MYSAPQPRSRRHLRARRRVRSSLLGALVAITVAGSFTAIAASPAAASSSTIVASDAMSRTSKIGWGAAATGGGYTADPVKSGSVAGGKAVLASPKPGITATMTLYRVRVLNVDSKIDFVVPKLSKEAGAVYVSHHVRVGSQGPGGATGSYGIHVMIAPDGGTLFTLARTRSFKATPFAQVVGPKVSPGQTLTLSVSATGTSPVVLAGSVTVSATTGVKARTFSLKGVDSSETRVTRTGGIGVAVYAGSRGRPTAVGFDNLRSLAIEAATVTAPAPAPVTPSPTSAPSPDPTTSPTPTSPPASSPDSTATLLSYPGKRHEAGAAVVGSTSYPVPEGAIFVAPNGSDSNPGTIDRPLATLGKASVVAAEGGTIVLRKGTYHESVFVYPRKGITIQPYPKEAVWFDGAETVSGWTPSGNVWVRSGWTTFFDSSPTYKQGAPDGTAAGWQWINPERPMAAHPDQIWLDGAALTEVGSRSAVTAGTFYVDRSAGQLVIGSDPSGKNVEASTLAKAFSIRAENSTIRGIGVRRYATSVFMMGTVTADVPGIKLEDVSIVDNATTGFFTWAKNVSLTRVTVENNGLMGMGASEADGLRITSLLSRWNNSQGFNPAPVSGAMKIMGSLNVSIRDSSFVDNQGKGPWFDEAVKGIAFTGNDIVGSEADGLVVEFAENAIIADNVIANNGANGIFVYDSGNVAIWNNTLVNNSGSIHLAQDDRKPGGNGVNVVSARTLNVSLANNVVAQERSDALFTIHDWSHSLTFGEMVSSSQGNVYQRASSATPSRFAYWSGSTRADYPLIGSVTSALGLEKGSREVFGASTVDSRFALNASAAAANAGVALSIPASVASVSTLDVGAKTLGADIP